MTQQYLMIKARNMITGQTVKNQAEELAGQLADKMTRNTGETWTGFVEEYVPSVRR